MGIKDEIGIVVDGIQTIINLVERVDPNAANNVVVIELQKVIDILKALGL